MANHRALTGRDAIHQASWVSDTDPNLVSTNGVLANTFWFQPTAGILWLRNSDNTDWDSVLNASGAGVVGDINVPFGSGTLILTPNSKKSWLTSFDLEILAARLWSPLGETGSAQIDIWSEVWATGNPTDSESITGGNELSISSASEEEDAVLTSWTKTFTGTRRWTANLDSVDVFTSLVMTLTVRRN